jgi:hypothetical protein
MKKLLVLFLLVVLSPVLASASEISNGGGVTGNASIPSSAGVVTTDGASSQLGSISWGVQYSLFQSTGSGGQFTSALNVPYILGSYFCDPTSVDGTSGLPNKCISFGLSGLSAGSNSIMTPPTGGSQNLLGSLTTTTVSIGATFDGGGSAIAADKFALRHMDWGGTVVGWSIKCDLVNSTTGPTISIYNGAYSTTANPTVALCATQPALAAGSSLVGAQGNCYSSGSTNATFTANSDMLFKMTTAPDTSTWCVLDLQVTRTF